MRTRTRSASTRLAARRTTREGASGGGGGTHDLLARHQAQADARDDYLWARKELRARPADLALFEAVVLEQLSIAGAAERAFEVLSRSQREDRSRKILRLCANKLVLLIGHRLPIKAVAAVARPVVTPAPAPTAPAIAANDPALRVAFFVDGKLLLARAAMTLGAIVIAEDMLAALQRETGCRDEYASLPLQVRPTWSWGCTIISAEESALQALCDQHDTA